MIACLLWYNVFVVSKNYHLKSKKGQRDERYKERLTLLNMEKYHQRISRSTVRAKVWYWRRQLENDLREKKKLESALKDEPVRNTFSLYRYVK